MPSSDFDKSATTAKFNSFSGCNVECIGQSDRTGIRERLLPSLKTFRSDPLRWSGVRILHANVAEVIGTADPFTAHAAAEPLVVVTEKRRYRISITRSPL